MPEVTLSATSLRILKVLIGTRPVTVPDVMKVLGVTRTAVVDQLRDLIAAGFVERVTAPPEQRRGRPRHLYSATPAAMLLLFVDAQRIVLPILWGAVNSACGKDLAGEVHQRIAAAIVEHYRPYVSEQTTAARARQLVKRLVDEGHLVDVSDDGQGHLVVNNRSCGFLAMSDDHRTACGIHLSGISGVLGAELRMTACRHDGAPCCSFEISLDGERAATSAVEFPHPGGSPFSTCWAYDESASAATEASDDGPGSSDGRLGSSDGRPGSSDGRPGSSDGRPGSSDGGPGSSNGRPDGSADCPLS